MAPIGFTTHAIRQILPSTSDFAILKSRSAQFTSSITTSLLQKRESLQSFTSAILRRQSNIIPTTYTGENTDPSPATVVAIVLGVSLGTLGLVLLIWWALWQQSGAESTPSEVIEVRSRRSRSPPPLRRSSHRRSSGPEVVEIRRVDRSRSPRRTRIVERVVEERVPRATSRRGSVVEEVVVEPSRPRSRRTEEVVYYDEESVSTDPPPRRTSYRRSGEREYVRRSVRG